MTRDDIEFVIETLRECWSEISAMQNTYDDYAASGHLEEHVEEALHMLERLVHGC